MPLEAPLEYPLGGDPLALSTTSGGVDHVATALARLPEQFKNKETIQKLVEIFIGPFVSLEAAFQQLLTERSIDTAIGVQLDVIGILVGERNRNGEIDALYRRRIKARVRTNRSSGLIEEYITITNMIVADENAYIRLERQNHLTLWVRVEDVAISHEVAAILIAFLKDATPGGMRVILQYDTADPSSWFRFDSGPGFDQGVLSTSLE
jgi:hypothetical protein